MERIDYKEGDAFKGTRLVFIRELPFKRNKIGDVVRIALFRCNCGTFIESPIREVKYLSRTSCGCKSRERIRLLTYKHGKAKHPIFQVWENMKHRILNKKTKDYKYYGARGIVIFPPWIHDFQLFYDYVSALPHFGEEKMTLDRIDVNGNYEPGNLRWVPQRIQNINIRRKCNNSSGYMGVGKVRNKWQATIGTKYIGCADTPEEAVTIRNNYIIANNLPEYKIQEVVQ
jgi:hypothetical protein